LIMRVAALLLPLLLLAGGCGPNRAEWIAENEALLASLPHYPGSARIQTQNLEIEEGDELTAHVVGYSTHVSYRPPLNVSARAIVRFFVVRLRRHGWEGNSTVVDRVPMACFTRGRAFVSVLTDGMVGRPGAEVPLAERTFEVGVNHAGAAPTISC
jgi:hypothetical protein